MFIKPINMTQQEIANAIINEFRKDHMETGSGHFYAWLVRVLSKKLSPEELPLIDPAIAGLVNEGLVAVDDNYEIRIILTEKGFNTIYPVDEAKTTEMLCQRIVNLIPKMNSVDTRRLFIELTGCLNPKEITFIKTAINKLWAEGLITPEQKKTFIEALNHDFMGMRALFRELGYPFEEE